MAELITFAKKVLNFLTFSEGFRGSKYYDFITRPVQDRMTSKQ